MSRITEIIENILGKKPKKDKESEDFAGCPYCGKFSPKFIPGKPCPNCGKKVV